MEAPGLCRNGQVRILCLGNPKMVKVWAEHIIPGDFWWSMILFPKLTNELNSLGTDGEAKQCHGFILPSYSWLTRDYDISNPEKKSHSSGKTQS